MFFYLHVLFVLNIYTASDQSGHISKSSWQTKPKKGVRRKVDGQEDTKAISEPNTSAKKLVKSTESNSIPETSTNTDESSDTVTSSGNERHAKNEQNVTHIRHTDTDMTFSKGFYTYHLPYYNIEHTVAFILINTPGNACLLHNFSIKEGIIVPTKTSM